MLFGIVFALALSFLSFSYKAYGLERAGEFRNGLVIYFNFRDDLKVERFSNVFVRSVRSYPGQKPEASGIEADLRSRALASFEITFNIVEVKEQSNYVIDIAMIQQTNYAVRNPDGVPADGFVMINVCKYPIRSVGDDCEQQKFYFFVQKDKETLFDRVLTQWIESVVGP
jgi:hypothetical protein